MNNQSVSRCYKRQKELQNRNPPSKSPSTSFYQYFKDSRPNSQNRNSYRNRSRSYSNSRNYYNNSRNNYNNPRQNYNNSRNNYRNNSRTYYSRERDSEREPNRDRSYSNQRNNNNYNRNNSYSDRFNNYSSRNNYYNRSRYDQYNRNSSYNRNSRPTSRNNSYSRYRSQSNHSRNNSNSFRNYKYPYRSPSRPRQNDRSRYDRSNSNRSNSNSRGWKYEPAINHAEPTPNHTHSKTHNNTPFEVNMNYSTVNAVTPSSWFLNLYVSKSLKDTSTPSKLEILFLLDSGASISALTYLLILYLLNHF